MRDAHRACEFSVIDVRVAFDHPQRRPSANHLDRAKRDAIRDHDSSASVAERMVRNPTQFERPNKASKCHADGSRLRRLSLRPEAEHISGRMTAGQQEAAKFRCDRYATRATALALDDGDGLGANVFPSKPKGFRKAR